MTSYKWGRAWITGGFSRTALEKYLPFFIVSTNQGLRPTSIYCLEIDKGETPFTD